MQSLDELFSDRAEFVWQDHRCTELPDISRVNFEVVGHVVPVELVDGVFGRMVPPAKVRQCGCLEFGFGKGALSLQHGNAQPEEGAVSILGGAAPGRRATSELPPLDR